VGGGNGRSFMVCKHGEKIEFPVFGEGNFRGFAALHLYPVDANLYVR
jgi:hypothetical protein